MFKQWMENLIAQNIVFVDLDETLVKTSYLVNANLNLYKKERILSRDVPSDPKIKARDHENNGGKIIKLQESENNWENTWFVTYLRPGAIEFIKALYARAKVCILTSGGKEFQTRVIQVHNIPIPEHNIYGKFNYEDVPQSPYAVLVDDLEETTSGVYGKLQAIGVGTSRFVHVEPWLNFSKQDDTGLAAVLPKIMQLLQ